MDQAKQWMAVIAGAWKAVLAAVVPLLVDIAVDVIRFGFEQVGLSKEAILTAASTSLAVYWKANKPG